jgi:hypothetical protein
MAPLRVLGVEVLYKCVAMLFSILLSLLFSIRGGIESKKRWNRITRLKRNDHTSVIGMHCMSHNRSHSSTLSGESMTLSGESMTIHSYDLDTKEEFDPMLDFCPS